MSRLLPRASSSGGPFAPSASASLQSCQVHGPKCPRCTGQWLAPVSLARHPEVSKQLGVSVRTHQSSLHSTRSFSQGTLKMTGVSLPRWLAPAMVAVTQQLSSTGLPTAGHSASPSWLVHRTAALVCRTSHCRGIGASHRSCILRSAGAQRVAITGVILLHGWPQPLRGISDPSQPVKEVETHTCPQLLVSSSIHTLAQGSFPDALWPESHLTSESVLKES